MNPSWWGPNIWYTIHTVAFTYPKHPAKGNIVDAKLFMKSLALNLPCSTCAKHMLIAITKGVPSENLKPLNTKTLKSRMSFFRWTYDFHDYVNKKKLLRPRYKRKNSPSFKSVVTFYNSKLIDKKLKLN